MKVFCGESALPAFDCPQTDSFACCSSYFFFSAVILQRQIAKESLAVFDGTKSNEKFNKEELKDCFTLKNCDCDTKRKLGKTWLDYSKFT